MAFLLDLQIFPMWDYGGGELAFLLDLQIFPMWDSDTNSPKRGRPGFPFLDLRAFLRDRDFGSWAHTPSVCDRAFKARETIFTQAKQSQSVRPSKIGPSGFYILSSSVAPFTPMVRLLLDQRINGVTILT